MHVCVSVPHFDPRSRPCCLLVLLSKLFRFLVNYLLSEMQTTMKKQYTLKAECCWNGMH